MTMALETVRVLDLTQVMAGPFCAQLLADFGADVVKVEPLSVGDQARRSLGAPMAGEDTAAFLAVNRNKRSLAVNLKDERGQAVFYRLVDTADILLENFRPGVTARLGIDYATLRERNPRLISGSISGFGQTGPYASWPGYDLMAQAMAGVMSVTGQPGGTPLKSGVPVGDLSAGLFCALGILSAYVARERIGAGQHVDTSLFEGALALSIWEAAEFWTSGHAPQPLGSRHRLSAPYQAYPTRDGYITIGANNQRLWKRLCDALDRPDLEIDERFATNAARMAHIDELELELRAALARRDTADWLDTLIAAGVPVAPIRDYAEVLEDAHTHARGMVVEIEHPVEGPVKVLGTPVKLSETPARVRRPAPLLGQHTVEVLAGAGYTREDIEQLFREGVVA
jgi:crotonobetainyl-CoA:carnitine CoA-transferase CaiB-like acyl-CoA transferase